MGAAAGAGVAGEASALAEVDVVGAGGSGVVCAGFDSEGAGAAGADLDAAGAVCGGAEADNGGLGLAGSAAGDDGLLPDLPSAERRNNFGGPESGSDNVGGFASARFFLAAAADATSAECLPLPSSRPVNAGLRGGCDRKQSLRNSGSHGFIHRPGIKRHRYGISLIRARVEEVVSDHDGNRNQVAGPVRRKFKQGQGARPGVTLLGARTR